jgi:hypothetical protein
VTEPAAALAVTNQPTSVEESEFFAITLEIRNGSGTLVQAGQDSAREVSVAVASGPGNVWGDLTETASAGVVQFDTLVFDATGSYVLEFSSPGLPTQTANITVVAASGGGSGSGDDGGNSDDNGSCSAGAGGVAPMLALLTLGLMACVLRRKRLA